MSSGSLRLKKAAALAIFVLVLSMTRAEIESPHVNEIDDGPNGRLYLNNQNSTLIPLGTSGSLLVSTVGIIALVIGSIFLVSLVFNPHGWKHGGGIFSPWLTTTGYPSSGYTQSQYYTQPQAQPYLYEPYSKLGYQQQQPIAR